MTFSIVAVDRNTGEAGFAISSCSWDSGMVGRTEAGTSAIVSQAKGNMLLRDEFIKKTKEGLSVQKIMDHFKEIDNEIEHRQLGMITQSEPGYSFTGENCTKYAGHRTGEDYAIQGNILVSEKVLDDMAEAYENTNSSIIERLYAALKAGDIAGGDARGKVSSRLCVTTSKPNWTGNDIVVDLRIEEHEEPVEELGRILYKGLQLRNGFFLTNRLNQAEGEKKIQLIHELDAFLDGKEDRAFIDMWGELANNQLKLGQIEKGVETYKKYLKISPKMRKVLKAMVQAGELPKEILE
jgi:uncharacterized Ntn-hydrolase superfamily protein